jgi:imidazolonepropionase-like amidohydrolase
MANAKRLLIKNGTFIDGSGGDPVPNRLLVVEGNWIALVGETDGPMRPETPDDTVIDAAKSLSCPASSTRIASSRFTKVRCRV